MKIRNGFVSNSSSSSFIVHDKDITIEQQALLEFACEENRTGWKCERTYGSTICYTSMDNFDMEEYMEKIGILADKIIWASDECEDYLDGPIDVNETAEEYEKFFNGIETKAIEILKTIDYNEYNKDGWK